MVVNGKVMKNRACFPWTRRIMYEARALWSGRRPTERARFGRSRVRRRMT